MSKLAHGVSMSQQGFISSSELGAELSKKANDKEQPDTVIRRVKGLYVLLLGLIVALMSLMAINYMEFFQDTRLRFEAGTPYELTSTVALGLAVFLSYVTSRCWLASREVFLRWLVLAFLGSTLIYLICIAIFAESSIAFIVSDLRSNLWWLAHGIFLAGFALLSLGAVQAVQATRALSGVYSKREMLEQLQEQQTLTREALAKLETKNAQLRRQAATDCLTGVANRRHFTWHAEREISRAIREGAPLSLLCLDLDHFKGINDVYGHQAGDQMLVNVARTIEKHLRPTDLLARTGGEEFQVLLPDATIDESKEIAERCRYAIHHLHTRFRGKVLSVTVSIGCAQLGLDGDNMDSLIYAGDQRLYEAKEHGRDRVG